MSKSYGNVILPTDDLDTITKGVKKMKIDPARQTLDTPGDPEKCTVYDLHYAFNVENNAYFGIADACKSAGIGCGECKKLAAEAVAKRFEGHKEKRRELENKDEFIREVLIEGSKKAERVASETVDKVKEHLLFDY